MVRDIKNIHISFTTINLPPLTPQNAYDVTPTHFPSFHINTWFIQSSEAS